MFAMPLRKQLITLDQSIWFQSDSSSAVAVDSKYIRLDALFSETSWASDVFVLFHNGVRRELKDLSNMIEYAARRTHQFEECELIAFEKWFVDFSHMVVMYFEAETNIVYPALLEMRLDLFSAIERQRERQMKLVKHLLEIHAECLMFTLSGKQSGTRYFAVGQFGARRCVDRIGRLIDGLKESLEQVFGWEVKALVPVVKEGLMKWEARALLRRCLREILEHRIGREVVWGYFRGVSAKFKEEQMAGFEPLRRMRLRVKERRWTREHQNMGRRFAGNGATALHST